MLDDVTQVQAELALRGEAHALVIELAAALHAAGAPAHRLEATVDSACRALGIRGQIMAQPTSLMLELDGRPRLMRVEPREIALDELVGVDRIARDLQQGRLSVGEARRRLARIRNQPPPWSLPTRLAAWGASAAAAAVFLGAGGIAIVLAALLSAAIGLGGHRATARAEVGRLVPLVGAICSVFLVHAVATLVPLQIDAVVLSALIVLLPGFTLTVGLTELVTRHLAAGTARLAAAGTTFLQLGVGVGLGEALAERLLGPSLVAQSLDPRPLPQALAVVGAALAFLVLFRGLARDLPAVVGVAFLAVHGTRLGGELLGSDAAPFLGALAVGLAANAYGRLRDAPSQVLLVPGILLLVPGSLGFRGVQAIVDGEGALLDGARMFVVGASLVTGLLASNAILPPRRTL